MMSLQHMVCFSAFRDLEGNQIETLNHSILKSCSKLEVLLVSHLKNVIFIVLFKKK